MDTSIALSAIPATLDARPASWASPIAEDASPAETPFSGLMKDAIGHMDQLESQANSAVAGFMAGTGVDIHQAVIATQKVEMAFELALSIRNKAVQAYQSVMGMQF
jgi:flagellar hook-basal body complex protein FliE